MQPSPLVNVIAINSMDESSFFSIYIAKSFFLVSTSTRSYSSHSLKASRSAPKLGFTISLTRKTAMNKFKKSQILILFLVAALLFIAPLLSSSLRPTYLYFVLNLLIIALGVEAGLLSVFSGPVYVAARPVTTQEAKAVESNNKDDQKQVAPSSNEKKVKVVEKSASEKIAGSVIKVDKVKKCPSTPSLFFIGSGETEAEAAIEEHEEEEQQEAEVGGLSGPELFTKAETFIGNFYKQLKMQREESWKRIHGFY